MLKEAFEREGCRVYDLDDEDDTDGWELELPGEGVARVVVNILNDTQEASATSFAPPEKASAFSPSSEDPFGSPLSSLPSSRSSSPLRGSPFGSPLSSLPSSRSPSPVLGGPSNASDPAPSNNPTRRTRRGRRRKRKQNKRAKERAEAYAKRKHLEQETLREERASEARSDPRRYVPSAHALKKLADVSTIETSFDVENLHAANGGFIGKRQGITRIDSDLERHIAGGSRLVKWDGRYVCTRSRSSRES